MIYQQIKFADLLGKTIKEINRQKDKYGKDIIKIKLNDDDSQYVMLHDQDCCESVTIEDICGHLEDLVDSPITMAEEVYEDNPKAVEHGTWTFYKLATVKGYVTIRWYGESNGYYSEKAGLYKVIE